MKNIPSLILSLAVAATVSLAQRVPSGVAVAADAAVVNNVKKYLMPTIMQEINNVAIPRIDF
jgi:uncharacterized membrane protein